MYQCDRCLWAKVHRSADVELQVIQSAGSQCVCKQGPAFALLGYLHLLAARTEEHTIRCKRNICVELDVICTSCMADKASDYGAKGATGAPVRTLIEFLERL